MFKETESYVKPTADIIVVDIDEARMIAIDSSEDYDGDDGTDWDFEEE